MVRERLDNESGMSRDWLEEEDDRKQIITENAES